jgi:DnaJ-domain-containing protein 1
MTDHFAVLGEARLPWLDAGALKEKFLALSSATHPDRVAAESEPVKQAAHTRSAQLNAAYQCLRDPKSRLQHLLELELGTKPSGIERPPADRMELFMQAGQLCQDVDAFLDERARTTSPLLKARMFARGLEWTERLNQFQKELHDKTAALAEPLRAMNTAWQKAPAIGNEARAASLPLESLQETYRTISYLKRWTEQIQERAVQLSL